MLDRDTLKSGAFLTSFREAPGIEWWTEERIEASMHETLARRPQSEPVWLFAYGSLICNPLFEFEESHLATLDGWHRSFCIRLVLARGSIEKPGRMLALEPGGSTEGLALRLREEDLEHELRMVWMREMVGGVYRPEWSVVKLADGRTAQSIIFAANPDNALYEQDASPDAVAPVIAAAHGSLGSNRDYVLHLHESLRRHGIVDAYIRELATRLEHGRR
ncbi:TPA: gamma-glutamylcyclotransferase [Burkholderia vietnamiensis]|nr:gamma-glutamylcyclotransferase [Burkholderia vietnamiensis]